MARYRSRRRSYGRRSYGRRSSRGRRSRNYRLARGGIRL